MHQWPPCTASFAEATTIEGSMVPRVTSGPSAPKSPLCIWHPRAQKRTGRLLQMTMNIDDGCISTWNFGVNVVFKEAIHFGLRISVWGVHIVHIQQNPCRTLLQKNRPNWPPRFPEKSLDLRLGPFWQRPSCSKWSDSRGPQRDLSEDAFYGRQGMKSLWLNIYIYYII